jgi:hypothetical protein
MDNKPAASLYVLYWFESNEDGGDCGILYGSHDRKILEDKKEELDKQYKEYQQKLFEHTIKQGKWYQKQRNLIADWLEKNKEAIPDKILGQISKDVFIRQIRETISSSDTKDIWNIENYLDKTKLKTPKPTIGHFKDYQLDGPSYNGKLIIKEIEVI